MAEIPEICAECPYCSLDSEWISHCDKARVVIDADRVPPPSCWLRLYPQEDV